jgi:hypothetical protein
MDGYFTTEEQQDAKNWKILQQGKEQKMNLVRLRHEARDVAKSLRTLCDAMDDMDSYRLSFHPDKIVVLRIDPNSRNSPTHTLTAVELATIGRSSHEFTKIQSLWEAFIQSKSAFERASADLKDLGVGI